MKIYRICDNQIQKEKEKEKEKHRDRTRSKLVNIYKEYLTVISDFENESRNIDITNSNDIISFKFKINNVVKDFDVKIDYLVRDIDNNDFDNLLEKLGDCRLKLNDMYTDLYRKVLAYRAKTSGYYGMSSKARVNTQYVGLSSEECREANRAQNHHGCSGSGYATLYGVSL